MKAVAIIPARMGSSRFPGKPMKKINGIPMIGHCYLRTRMSAAILETYVATCDVEIYEYINAIGGKAIMTSSSHDRASDRTAEAMIKIENIENIRADTIVMVQGDEPMITPGMIDTALQAMMVDPSVNVVNLMANINSVEEFRDPNEIKVVVDKNSDAIYFSRDPIPFKAEKNKTANMLKQVCVIPFRRDYLLKFTSLPESDLERIESIDMLRVLEYGDKVRMVWSEDDSYSVDTEADLRHVAELMENDEFVREYSYNG